MKVNAHVSTIASQRIRMGKIRGLDKARMDGKTGRGQMIGRRSMGSNYISSQRLTSKRNNKIDKRKRNKNFRGENRVGTRSSPTRKDQLQKYGIKTHPQGLNLQIDVKTRWNSMLAMLRTFCSFKRKFEKP